METRTQNQKREMLVSIIRQPYCWPGGYERLIATEDGALLCKDCVRKQAGRIMSDIRDNYNTGWLPASATYEAVSAECTKEMAGKDYVSFCAHCGKEIGELGA